MKKVLAAFAGLLFCAMVTAVPASADTIIFDNSLVNPGGTLTSSGGVGVGTVAIVGGVIDTVGNLDTAVAAAVTGSCGSGGFGCLDILSGAFIGAGTNPNSFEYSSAGSTLTITGTAAGGGPLLYSGSFDPATVLILTFDTTAGGAFTGTGTLTGTLLDGSLDATLAAFLGVPALMEGGTDANNFFKFVFSGAAPNGSGTVTTNTVQLTSTAVPEPGTMALFGLGLAAAARVARRRLKSVA